MAPHHLLVLRTVMWLSIASTFAGETIAQTGSAPLTPCADFSVPPPPPPVADNALGDEFVGPFASWADLKRDFGAAGDGVTDDTNALQQALSTLSTSAGHAPILYIPAGTYLVTHTVTVMAAQGISVIGQDPSTTTLKWGGPANGILLHVDGVAYSRFNRITFDGSRSAGVLVDQSVENYTQGRVFDTGNEYADDVFQNSAVGIQGGQYGLGAAKSSVLRSTFLNNTVAGIALKNFNALDWWVWYSSFNNNRVGSPTTPAPATFMLSIMCLSVRPMSTSTSLIPVSSTFVITSHSIQMHFFTRNIIIRTPQSHDCKATPLSSEIIAPAAACIKATWAQPS